MNNKNLGKHLERPKTIKEGMARLKTWQLVLGLMLVVGGTVLFMGAVGGWFSGNQLVVLDAEYYCRDDCNNHLVDLNGGEYEDLVGQRKSFVVFVDQGGCKTADNLRQFVLDWAKEKWIKVYRLMFSDMKETSLHNDVKYYPSVVVVSNGRVIGYLRADSDEDAEAYNKYDAFMEWVKKFL